MSVMTLPELVATIPGFAHTSHADKIKLFAWYLHSQKGQDRFNQTAIRSCYDALHLEKPTNISSYIQPLTKKKPREVLKDSRGFYLEAKVRTAFDSKYGEHEITVAVRKLLSELPGKIPSEAERRFLSEALLCFKHQAFRSAIVMTWNLAFFHLTDWIFDKHLAAFNAQIPKNYPKSKADIKKRTDFGDQLKESEVIEIARSASLIEAGVKKVLKEKLDKRNTAAHPSSIEVTQLTAEEFITDLVNNVVLKLS